MPYYYLYLVGYLEQRGITAAIADPHENCHDGNVRSIIDTVQKLRPRFVGLASFVTDYALVLDLARMIRAVTNVPLIVGNAHPSIAPSDFLYAGSPVTVVVRGEGELTIEQLISEYGKAPLRDIPGIAFLGDDGVVLTPKRALMDLSECGMPAYHAIDMSWYTQVSKYVIRRLAMVGGAIYTGRGCPYSCVFCASNTVWAENARPAGTSLVRRRPLSMVMDELRLLQDRYGYDFFYILDDTFGLRREDIVEFCDAYRASGLRMLWAAETRVNCINDEDIVRVLRDAGCIQLDFGVESGSPAVLRTIRKAVTVEETRRAFALCRKGGMRTFANILINLPGETDADAVLTERLLREIRPTYISIGATQPYPGTALYAGLPFPVHSEHYALFNRSIPPDEFRLAAHTRNLYSMLISWQLQFGAITCFERSLYRAGARYWQHILNSRHRLAYVRFFLKDTVLTLREAALNIFVYVAYRLLGSEKRFRVFYDSLKKMKQALFGLLSRGGMMPPDPSERLTCSRGTKGHI